MKSIIQSFRELIETRRNIEFLYDCFGDEPSYWVISLEYDNKNIYKALDEINYINSKLSSEKVGLEIIFQKVNDKNRFIIKDLATGDYGNWSENFLGHYREQRLNHLINNKTFLCVGQKRSKHNQSPLIPINIVKANDI